LTSGTNDQLQINVAVNAAGTTMNGTFLAQPAPGVTACAADSGTVAMVRE